jgi:NAD(P)-dependent dehydrogenase (short-subunit alcohol dehydrogenase family)
MSVREGGPDPFGMFSLAGKVALVTGGSRGLGRAIVLGLARAGADVVVSSRKLAACESVAAEVEGTTGRHAFAYACHVGHWDEVDRLVDATYDRFGTLDVLVNNAGSSPLYPDVASVSEDLFDRVVGVNMKGPFRLTALVGTRMAGGVGGSIINVSTIGSLMPNPTVIPYAAAKAGLNAMTVAFAQTFAPKVRVNGILPGAFLTDITKEWSEEMKSGSTAALRRIGNPDEVVGAAVYLASDASSYTTGALLRVDGGVASFT